MSIVHLTAEHYDEICQLWQAAGLEFKPTGRDSKVAFNAQLATGVQTVIGIREDTQLIAVVVATHDSRKGWINRIAVHPAYLRRGIATQLISACEQHFEQLGIQVICALVEQDNAASLALFQQAGYHLHQDVFYLSKRAYDGA